MARAPMTTPIIVALDGPAGSGKSSVSMAAARQLAFAYLDTGAAYRAVAWHVLEHDIDAEDPAAVTGSLENLEIIFDASPDHFSVSVGSTNVTEAIRTPEVTALVSAVARVPAVRAFLNQRFRETMA